MINVLMIDSDLSIIKEVKQYFSNRSSINISKVSLDGEDALKVFYSTRDIALIVLDVMMPKMDGYETLRALRRESNVPVIMLTAKSEEADEVLGFASGADDYIQKPFSPKILIARINAILNRNRSVETIIEIPGIKIDKIAHEVFIDGKPVDFTFKEFELLVYFIKSYVILKMYSEDKEVCYE